MKSDDLSSYLTIIAIFCGGWFVLHMLATRVLRVTLHQTGDGAESLHFAERL